MLDAGTLDMELVAGVLPLIAAGAGVGFLIGLTGVAGASLMTPLLISTFGVSPEIAVGTDLLYASITKIGAVWRHGLAKHIVWRLVLMLALGSVPASLSFQCSHSLGSTLPRSLTLSGSRSESCCRRVCLPSLYARLCCTGGARKVTSILALASSRPCCSAPRLGLP